MVKFHLAGAIPALVTPLTPAGDLDIETLDRIVDRAIRGGVDAVSPCGTTGEGWHLDEAARRRVVGRVVDDAAGRVPVVSWVPATTFSATLAEVQWAADAGVSAVLMAPPNDGSANEGADQADFFARVLDATPVPVVLYHIPRVSGVTVDLATIRAVVGHPRLAGLKDSSRDMEYLQQAVWAGASCPEFGVVTGSDTLLVAALICGAAGTIAASPGVFPAFSTGIIEAVRAGDLDRAWALQRQLVNVVTMCRQMTAPLGWKSALEHLGFGTARLVERPDTPSHTLTPDPDALAELAAVIDAMQDALDSP